MLCNLTSRAKHSAFIIKQPTVWPQKPQQLQHNAKPSLEYLNEKYILCPKSQLHHSLFPIPFPQRHIMLRSDCWQLISFSWCMLLLLNGFNQATAIFLDLRQFIKELICFSALMSWHFYIPVIIYQSTYENYLKMWSKLNYLGAISSIFSDA